MLNDVFLERPQDISVMNKQVLFIFFQIVPYISKTLCGLLFEFRLLFQVLSIFKVNYKNYFFPTISLDFFNEDIFIEKGPLQFLRSYVKM